MIKAVRRCPDVSNERVLDEAPGKVLERRSVKAHQAQCEGKTHHMLVVEAMRW